MTNIYLAGIDTLVVGYALAGQWSEDDVAVLDKAKAKAQEKQFDSDGTAINLHDRQFRLLPKGKKGYEWIVANDDVSITLARELKGGAKMPEAMVSFRSAYLWRDGWQTAEKQVRKWLEGFAAVVGHKVSRADLMVDVNAEKPRLDLTSGQIGGYAQRHDEYVISSHGRGRTLTGYSFGSGHLSARMYDKVREAGLKGKQWFFPLWAKNGWDGVSPITRMEFEWHRPKLKEFQTNTMSDLGNQSADLWKYSTETWLLLREPVETDSNARRWPPSDLWKTVQGGIAEFGASTGVARLDQVRPRYHRLLRVARGNLASAIAIAGTTGLGKKYGWKAAREWLRKEFQSEEFRDLVEARAAKFATME